MLATSAITQRAGLYEKREAAYPRRESASLALVTTAKLSESCNIDSLRVGITCGLARRFRMERDSMPLKAVCELVLVFARVESVEFVCNIYSQTWNRMRPDTSPRNVAKHHIVQGGLQVSPRISLDEVSRVRV